MGVQQIAVLLLHQCQPAVAVVPANIRGPSHRSVLHGGNGGAKIGFQHQSTVFLGDLSDIAYRPGVVLGKGLVEFLIAQSGHSRFLSAAHQQHQHRRQQDHPFPHGGPSFWSDVFSVQSHHNLFPKKCKPRTGNYLSANDEKPSSVAKRAASSLVKLSIHTPYSSSP